MAFLRLDCDFVNSSTWYDRDARDVFLTAMLLARPEYLEEQPQLSTRDDTETGWRLPAGWYGFVPHAVVALVARAGLSLDDGLAALDRLGAPEALSRSRAHDGRRLVRVDGGFVVLSYMRFREKDHTAAERKRRQRDRERSEQVSRRDAPVTGRDVTQAKADADAKAPPPTGDGRAFALQAPELKAKAKPKGKGRKLPAGVCTDAQWRHVTAAYRRTRDQVGMPAQWGVFKDTDTNRRFVARIYAEGYTDQDVDAVLDHWARGLVSGSHDPKWTALDHLSRTMSRYLQEAAGRGRGGAGVLRGGAGVLPVGYMPALEDPTPEEIERDVQAAYGRVSQGAATP